MTDNKLKGIDDNYKQLTSRRLLRKHSLGELSPENKNS